MAVGLLAIGCAVLAGTIFAEEGIAADPFAGFHEFDGKPVVLRPVRLSAYPFNQVWPGYQRPLSQTKRGAFVQFDVEKADWLAVDFGSEERAARAESVCRIRPLSRASKIRRVGRRLQVKVAHPEQFLMEFPGVADDLHVFADPPFVRKPAKDEIYFGPGVHQAGLIRPKSGQTVCLDAGAYVYGSIFVSDVSNVRIVGRGVLDSSQMIRKSGDDKVLQNQMDNLRFGKGEWNVDSSTLTAIAVTNLTVEGITLVDAPFWTVILRECEGTTIDNVKIVGQWRYNSDGIDVCDSSRTTIRNTFVRSFDDCIVARGCQLDRTGRELDGLSVDNCVLWCDWGKNFEVWGMRQPGAIRNVSYRNSKCINPSHVVCNVTLWGGLGDIVFENIAFEDIEVDLVRPLPKSHFQKADSPDARYPGGEEDSLRLVSVNCNGSGGKSVLYRNISVRNIRALGDEGVALVAELDPKDPILRTEGLVFENLPARTDIRGKCVRTGKLCPDAPGSVFIEGAAVSFRADGLPAGRKCLVRDWLGAAVAEGAVGADGCVRMTGIPVGYYRLSIEGCRDATFAVVPDPAKPLFYVQHKIPKGTVGGAAIGGQDSGRTTAILKRYPNAVAFCGHKHRMCTDEHSLWQGAFTALEVPALYACSTPAGRENGRSSCDSADPVPPLQMPAPATESDGPQGLVMSVYADRIVFERREFQFGQAVAEPWVVPWPNDGSVSYEARRERESAPRFAADAFVSVRSYRGTDRKGTPTDQLEVSFPAARSTSETPQAFDYEVRAVLTKADVTRIAAAKRVFSPKCYWPEAYDTNAVTCVFAKSEIPSNRDSLVCRGASAERLRPGGQADCLGAVSGGPDACGESLVKDRV